MKSARKETGPEKTITQIGTIIVMYTNDNNSKD